MDELLRQAVEVDVMDLAGRIISNPRRARVSLAGEVAMAMAIERLQAVAIETEILVNRLEEAMPWAATDDEHVEAVALQMAEIRDLIRAMRGEPNTDKQETNDGSSHS